VRNGTVVALAKSACVSSACSVNVPDGPKNPIRSAEVTS